MTAPLPFPARDLLEVRGLQKLYPVSRRGMFRRHRIGEIRAVDDISFSVARGQTLGLVGESGCGKSTTARAILHLIDASGGEVRLGGQDLLQTLRGPDRKAELAMRRRVQYVFQDPYLSLNPRWTIAQTLSEPLRVHDLLPRPAWRDRVIELLDLVGLEPHHADRYPHEFSGGQRQRVGIARALAVDPELLILDEPVSSLDVSVRAQILNLLARLQAELGLTYLFISHDLSSVRFLSTRVAVMYLGKIVEIADVDRLFEAPRHPYSRALLSAIPVPDPDRPSARNTLLGEIPSAMNMPAACRFHTRCPRASAVCKAHEPPMEPGPQGSALACHHPLEPPAP
ncbi:MAG TPA: peptide ABC transporter substrate-binding protein [Citreicella sp.]|nr:peptide ABC transporter substrate-binding protein [Citreicella sp.]